MTHLTTDDRERLQRMLDHSSTPLNVERHSYPLGGDVGYAVTVRAAVRERYDDLGEYTLDLSDDPAAQEATAQEAQRFIKQARRQEPAKQKTAFTYGWQLDLDRPEIGYYRQEVSRSVHRQTRLEPFDQAERHGVIRAIATSVISPEQAAQYYDNHVNLRVNSLLSGNLHQCAAELLPLSSAAYTVKLTFRHADDILVDRALVFLDPCRQQLFVQVWNPAAPGNPLAEHRLTNRYSLREGTTPVLHKSFEILGFSEKRLIQLPVHHLSN